VTELQQSRYDGLLRRVGDLKGPGSKVNDVLEELFPTFDVENLPAELYILAKTQLCMGGGFVAAVASQAGRGQILNPTGSGKIMTVTQAGVSTSGDTTARWGRRDTPLTTAGSTQIFRDTRHSILNLPTGQVRSQSSVALANASGQMRSAANTGVVVKDTNGLAVLSPGAGFEIGVSTVNVNVNFYFYWRERVAEPSELNI